MMCPAIFDIFAATNSTSNTTAGTLQNALIALPQELLSVVSTDSSARLLYSFHNTAILFPVRNNTDLEIGSVVVGALVAGMTVAGLKESINITLGINGVCNHQELRVIIITT